MQTALCPSAEQLVAFQSGKLKRDELDQIAGHLESCAACQTALNSAATLGDALVRELKQAGADPYTEESACRRAVSAVEALANSVATDTRDETTENIPNTVAPTAVAAFGKYQLLEQIGRGGMGEVYKAKHTVLNRIVAVKILPPNRLNHADAIARFRREIEAAGRLDHPHIVRASDADCADGRHFLVMEWLAGEDLAQYVKAHGPLSVDVAWDFIRQAALGLDYAHKNGLVHRDVKPSNLFLTTVREGEAPAEPIIKVLDLGLALLHNNVSAETDLTSDGQVMGSYDFIAPEQAMESHSVDHRADIYSLGCTLYYLLTAHTPFQGKSEAKKLLAHQLDQPTPLTQYRTDVPIEVIAVLNKMMAKDPAQRFGSMRELADTLADDKVTGRQGDKATGRASDTVIVSADHPVTLSPLHPVKKRSPLVAALWVLAGLAAVVALTFGIIRIATPEGDYIIETDDKDFAFSVSKGTVILEDKLKKRTYHLKVVKQKGGEFELEVTDAGNELVFTTKTFSIKRGEKVTLKAWFVRKGPEVAADPDRRAAEWVLSVGGDVVIAPWQPIKDAKDLPAGQFRVVFVNVSHNQKVEDADLMHFKDLAELQGLRLLRTKITDAGLLHLKDLKKLELLNLHGTRITDAGLTTIKGMPKLKSLGLDYTEVTDGALVHVKAMANLEELAISSTKVTEAGLIHLTALPKLRALTISVPLNDRVTAHLKKMPKLMALGIFHQPNDDCLAHLEALPQLRELDLVFSKVSDAGLARLRVLPNLEWLDLHGTPVGDAGLEHLKSLPKLTLLNLKETKVTTDGVKKVAAALPLCKIESDNGMFGPSNAVDDAWLKTVATLPARNQVEAVASKLRQLNTGFEGSLQAGTVKFKEEKNVVTELEFAGDKVTDLSPLRALPGLRVLNCSGKDKSLLADLSPLKGMKLTHLNCQDTRVADLAPLKDMPLTELILNHTRVSNLAPLKGMKLTVLHVNATSVTGLEALADMKLKDLRFNYTKVSDLAPLKGMSLAILECNETQVSDLTPLREMPLTRVFCKGAKVADLAPLQAAPLDTIECDFKRERDEKILRSIKTLTNINGKAAAEVLGRKGTPVDDAWLKMVAALPAEKQVDAVAAKLKDLNPLFDGKIKSHRIERDMVKELSLQEAKVADISPLRALPRLQQLILSLTEVNDLSPLKELPLTNLDISQTKVSDLSPLKKLNLTFLQLVKTPVSDLGPLQGMPLRQLEFSSTTVADLSPLKGMPLEILDFQNTKVSSLAALKGMKLIHLNFDNTKVSDLSPLQGMPLSNLFCSRTKVSDLTPLKGMKLKVLHCEETKVSDLTPLKGMTLNTLNCYGANVADLAPLHGMPLKNLGCADTEVTSLVPLKGMKLDVLDCENTKVSDLAPLQGMKLINLLCANTRVTDLSPLKGMPLTVLRCDFRPERDAEILRSLTTLQSINRKPAEQFWKEVDASKAGAGELSEDMKAIVKGLFDVDPVARGEAALNVAKLGDKAAVPALMKRLADDAYGWTRKFSKRRNGEAPCKDLAFDALVKLAPEKAVAGLQGALKSKNIKGREWACFTLGFVKDKEAEAVLVSGSMDQEPVVRAAAAKALGQRGGEAEESTRKRLRELTEDSDATVRAAAVEALTKVRAKPKGKDSK